MIYTIYKCTNVLNGKEYIGKTSTSIEKRFLSHLKSSRSKGELTIFHKALKKYGAESFKLQEICVTNISANINYLETVCIVEYGSHMSEGGYNMTYGGDGFDSVTVSENNKKRVIDGTHPWAGAAGSKLNSNTQKQLIAEGRHHFAGEAGSEFAKINIANRTKEGTNSWAGEAGSEFAKELAAKLLAEGRHHSQKEYACPHCGKTGTGNAMLKWHFNNCRLKTG